MRTPFLGPAYTLRSKNLSDQRLINLYADIVETKNGKDVGAFYSTPGLDFVATVGSGPIRGGRVVGHQNTLFVVSGPQVFALDALNRTRLVGTIGSNTGPVTMIDNANQLAIFDGANGYFSNGSTVSQISFPISGNLISCAYQDGFGLVNVQGTQEWFQSNSFDLSTWGALNFTSADAQPDNVMALADVHREVWLLKQFTTEVWINAGIAGFAFQRLQGTFLEVGIAAPYSVVNVGESLIWLAINREGQITVVMTNNYTATRISTFALEFEIGSYSTVSDAIGMTYSQEGHLFYILAFPSGNHTWCYDVSSSHASGIPMWHERASFSSASGKFNRHPANMIAAFNGNVIVGDDTNGNLYKFDLDGFTDNGAQRKWLRSWRALPKPSEEPQTFNSLRIDMETGANVSSVNPNPQCMLRWSDDGGHTWSPMVIASCGQLGQTSRRVKFNRLGSTNRSRGLDRIFELSSTDQFRVGLIGAELN